MNVLSKDRTSCHCVVVGRWHASYRTLNGSLSRITKLAAGKIILVFNKTDKIIIEELEILNQLFEQFDAERVYISARRNKISKLCTMLCFTQLNFLKWISRMWSWVTFGIRSTRKSIVGYSPCLNQGLENGLTNDLLALDIPGLHGLFGRNHWSNFNDEIWVIFFGKFLYWKVVN